MARLRILTLVSVLSSVMVFFIKNRTPSTIAAGDGLVVNKAWLTTNAHLVTPAKDVRPPDQTFLTYPEWFLVFSPAEQAEYFKRHTSTTFPYMKHVDQVWQGYKVAYHQIKDIYPFNTGYHVMIMVIAGSTTIEYGLKAWYETVMGRVTEPTEGETDEDRFGQQYMASYVAFIEDTPWYEYNFNEQLQKLWSGTSFFGPHLLRKLERKYFLTTELMVKSGYGWLIKQGTKASYDAALLNTAVIIDELPADTAAIPELKDIKPLKDGSYLANLPRYADFNPSVVKLAAQGVTFTEIAGNNSAIMFTVLTDKAVKADADYKMIFTQPIPTKPGLNRVALVTKVSKLSTVLNAVLKSGASIEHVYDY